MSDIKIMFFLHFCRQ